MMVVDLIHVIILSNNACLDRDLNNLIMRPLVLGLRS
jgi:hypothetical protein